MSSLADLIQKLAEFRPYRPSSNPTRLERRGRLAERCLMAIMAIALATMMVVALAGMVLYGRPIGAGRLVGGAAYVIFMLSGLGFALVQPVILAFQLRGMRRHNAHHDAIAIDHDHKFAQQLLSYSLDELGDVSQWLATRVEQIERRIWPIFGEKAPVLATFLVLLTAWKVLAESTLLGVQGAHALPIPLLFFLIVFSIFPLLVRALCSTYAYQRQILVLAINYKERERTVFELAYGSPGAEPTDDVIELSGASECSGSAEQT